MKSPNPMPPATAAAGFTPGLRNASVEINAAVIRSPPQRTVGDVKRAAADLWVARRGEESAC